LKDDDLVFCHIDGRPLLPDSVTHAWIKLRNRNGFKNVRLHDARHTHASIMLKNGTHPKIVQERLGHSSVQITLDTYSHVVPGLQAVAAAKFDDILKPKEHRSDNALNNIIENGISANLVPFNKKALCANNYTRAF
jgi:integrase